jgi:O-6-methylguanine DNA methyltransferase
VLRETAVTFSTLLKTLIAYDKVGRLVQTMEFFLDTLDTQVGEIQVVIDPQSERLCALEFSDHTDRLHAYLTQHWGEYTFVAQSNPMGITDRLRLYFTGHLEVIDTIPVAMRGTDFQQTVWAALRRIPVGETRTYGQIATELGNPLASRAVGHANSLNPIGIVVPCHRVIGANRRLTGYAGGLSRKDWLLQHEGVVNILDQKPAESQQMRLF